MSVWQALRHPAVLMLTTALFFTYTGGYAFWFWFPTILQRLTGWTDVRLIGWVGAIPFAAATVGLLFVGWNSDRLRERRWHFAVPQLAAAAALGAWFLLPHSNALLVVLCSIIGDRHGRLLPSFLYAAFRIPDQRGSSSGRRIHQLHGEYRRIFRTEDFR